MGVSRPRLVRALPAVAVLLAVWAPSFVAADDGPPIHLTIVERDAGRYEVQWRVPRILPGRAIPIPVLPEGCVAVGDREVVEQADFWMFRRTYRCKSSLAGQTVSLRYPVSVPGLTTVIRIDLATGDRFGHVLAPGELTWRIPRGTVVEDPLRRIRSAVAAGVSHALASWPHIAMVVALVLLGGLSPAVRLVTLFSLGQLAGLLVTRVTIAPPAVAGMAVALAAALVAARAATPGRSPDGLSIPVLVAGGVHGTSLAALAGLGSAPGGMVMLLGVLGMDAALLTGVILLAGVGRAVAAAGSAWSTSGTVRRALAYATGIGAMAFAFALAVGAGPASSESLTAATPVLPGPAGAQGQRTGSRPVASRIPEAPVRSYLAVEPFEVRHEVMLRVSDIAAGLGLAAEPGVVVEIEDQPGLTGAIVDLVLERTDVSVDGERPAPVVRRADFMIVGPGGALPRTSPEPELVELAFVGVVVAYPTAAMPSAMALTWRGFEAGFASVPVTMIDPESVRTVTVDESEPTARWVNQLAEDPLPAVTAVPVEPERLPIPWLALPLLILAAVLMIRAPRGPAARRPAAFALSRVALAIGLLVGPVVSTAVAVPGSERRRPSDAQARRILAALLPNVYHAMEYGDEEAIYDRLEISVTGDALTDVYLEQRRTLRFEERGGAQARVEAVEVLEAGDLETRQDGGFSLRAVWTAGGTVTHFGHRHFRQNRYDARVGLAPVDGAWKIDAVEVLEQERVR